ncbi:copper-binding transcription factor [Coemansia nantahalensis]|nr:copper-binding transcription factor [Coemansia nantahalensis]
MIIIKGQKFACDQCVRGHRASSCNHTERSLNPIKRKGRPPSQCDSCRALRLTRKAHVKCECRNKGGASATVAGPASASAPESPAKLRAIAASVTPKTTGSNIESLLNPCNCGTEQFCTCCKPRIAEFLSRSYPTQVVEQEALTLGQSLKRPRPIAPAVAAEGASHPPPCPSGPDAACCASGNRAPRNGPHSAGALPRPAPPLQAQPRPQLQRYDGHQRLPGPNRAHPYEQPPANQPPTAWAGPRLPLPPHGPHQRQNVLPAPGLGSFSTGHRPPPPSLPSGAANRPSCACGCQCSQKLDLLVRAIEARLGQEGLAELTSQADLGPSLSTMRSPPTVVLPVSHMAPSGVRPGSYGPAVSTLGSMSAPQTARHSSFQPPRLLAHPISRSRSSSTSSAASSVHLGNLPATHSPVRELSPPASPAHPHPHQFADGVIAPVGSAALGRAQTGVCRPSVPADPQQELPVRSCCSPKPASERAASGKPCCAGSGAKSCACCRRGWRPTDASRPEVDADGALACSCGCHKPLAECTNCVDDECEKLIFSASI